MPVEEPIETDAPDAARPSVLARGVALSAVTAVCTAFVAGVTAPLAGAAPSDSARALVVKSPYAALAQCGGVAHPPAPEFVPPEVPQPSVAPPAPSTSPSATPSAKPKPFALRINSGGPAVFDGGVAWVADRHYTGGNTFRSPTGKVKSATPKVDADERWGVKGYQVPVPRDGKYQVRLHLTELTQLPGQRIMDISLEGKRVAAGIDVAQSVGRDITTVLEYTVVVRDGVLSIGLSPSASSPHPNPSITGLEVISKS